MNFQQYFFNPLENRIKIQKSEFAIVNRCEHFIKLRQESNYWHWTAWNPGGKKVSIITSQVEPAKKGREIWGAGAARAAILNKTGKTIVSLQRVRVESALTLCSSIIPKSPFFLRQSLVMSLISAWDRTHSANVIMMINKDIFSLVFYSNLRYSYLPNKRIYTAINSMLFFPSIRAY